MNQQRDAAAAASFGELFAQFASMASHVFWVYDLDPEENVVYVSPSFERIWGRPAADLYARSWGGSIIQAWISAGTLRDLGYNDALQLLQLHTRSPGEAQQRWHALTQTWWQQHDPNGGR